MAGSGGPPWGGTVEQHSRSNVPQWMLGPDDIGQEMVLVLRRKPNSNESDRNPNVALPDPFVVGSSIQKVIGVKEARSIETTREGRGARYLLRTGSRSIAEKLMKITKLCDGSSVEIVSHPTLNTVQGIVFEPDSINLAEEQIQIELDPQGVHTVRRIRKRINGKLVNTPLLVLSFSGSRLPEVVFFGLLRIAVKQYYPSPMMCFHCGFYGHSRKFCQQTGICLRCSTTHNIPDGEQCDNEPRCPHCKGGHPVLSRDCPKYKEEEKIIKLKIDRHISHAEARRICSNESRNEGYKNVVQDQILRELAMKDQLIATLQQQVATLVKEIASLKKTLASSNLEPQTKDLSHDVEEEIASNQPTSDLRATPPTAQPSSSKQNRQSRKDKIFTAPPDKSTGSRCNSKPVHDMQTRSKSGKRQYEISPTNTDTLRGKRFLVPPNTSNDTIEVDE